MSTVDWIPNEITAAARQRALQAGESLFRQGDKTYGIFAIVKGRVQMIRYDSHGRSLVLFTAAEGELFAEAALFSETYHCDAVAATEATVRIFRGRLCWPNIRVGVRLGPKNQTSCDNRHQGSSSDKRFVLK